MNDQNELREHLIELLDGRSAHVDLATVLKVFPISEINTRVENSPHTAWELLEHIRIAQSDILEFSRDAGHTSPEFPGGYWNPTVATAEDWRRSVEQVLNGLQALRDMVSDQSIDLYAKIPHGTGQTLLREVLLTADHNAYHLGQIMLVRRILEQS
ncbi:DinB family protein [soil metagenome]